MVRRLDAVGGAPFTVMPLKDAIVKIVNLGSRRQDNGGGSRQRLQRRACRLRPAYAELLATGDLVFTDGLPVAWAGRRLRRDVATRWSCVWGFDGIEDRADGHPINNCLPL
jgi:hypothetical protein